MIQSMIKGLVSVIIPTYNRADSLVEAIRSAKAQTYPLTEIVVVDDGSCDHTALRAAELEGVSYYCQEHRGQGAARNFGLARAKGQYIASLDSDDLWDEDFLTRSVECLEKFELDFVFSNWIKVRGDKTDSSEWLRDGAWKRYQTNLQGEWSLLGPAQLRSLFLERCPAPSSSLLMRRSSIVSGWGEQMQIADDWYLLLDMALARPCRAAFTLNPRWKKRVDGMNVYDGQPFAETIKKLYLHDYPFFARDFRLRLTRREKLALAGRPMKYRALLSLHRLLRMDFAVRVKLPAAFDKLRGLTRPVTTEEHRIQGRVLQEE